MGLLVGDIGTIEWCRATKGVLRPAERVRFMTAVLAETARLMPRIVAARAGVRGSGPDPSRFAPPEGPLVSAALEACAHLDPMLIEHGYRSYLFARALGEVEGRSCDPEALLVAALFHDYAFSTMESITDRCFTLAGAEVTEEVLRRAATPPDRLHDILDGITLHLNPTVPAERGALQHLLHDGILLDVVGARAWELDADGIDRVLERHPRHDFVRRGEGTLRAHGRRVRGSRTGALFTCGFAAALRLGPWRAAERAAAADARA
jgi:hypothetical protein